MVTLGSIYIFKRLVVLGAFFSLTLAMLPTAASGQSTPVITGPNGASSAAFWYLGGVTPNCCADLTYKYWTVWQINLAANTPNPSPVVQWFTDSPSKLLITQAGPTGALLQSVGPSSPGNTFDIRVWAAVDGVQSNLFPVFINRPWVQSQVGPSNPGTCAATISANYPNGWVGRVQNSLTDLTGNAITPLVARETFENSKGLYTNENWTSTQLQEAAWSSMEWTGSSFFDTYALCWAGSANLVIPNTVAWNPNGGTAIYWNTQKYWVGSYSRFVGACTERQALTWYTNHLTIGNKTTPISTPSVCNPGQFANN